MESKVKRAFRRFLACTVLMAGVLLLYERRFQVEALLWHWRHGHSISVGDYEVPVPDGWLVWDYDQGLRSVTLFDTHSRTPTGQLRTSNSIQVLLLSPPTRTHDLGYWEAFKRQSLEREGLRNIESMSFRAADENVVCLGGSEFNDAMHVPSTAALVSFECGSSGQLTIMFVGYRQGVQDFYTIASQIRKDE